MPKLTYLSRHQLITQATHGLQKAVIWVGSTKRDLACLSDELQDVFGYAIDLAQRGMRHPDAKSMKGNLRNVTEVVANHLGDTFRTMYTTQFRGAVYVLHVFQKKSKHGIATPRTDLALIEKRYNAAKIHYETCQKNIHPALSKDFATPRNH